MATVTQQDVAPLHRHLNITINKEDYLPTFEKSLKEYGKKANIPGFRKGMVPAGLIKKMYGSSLFVDEVLKVVDKEVYNYLNNEKLDIFAQPLPVDMDINQLDVNNPNNYNFTFEVGMKPEFQLPDLKNETVKNYKVDITDDMLNEEVERLQNRFGNVSEPEAPNTEASAETTEVEPAEKKIEPHELNEEFYKMLFPTDEIRDEATFRSRLREEMQKQWDAESKNQLQHSIYHILLEHTSVDLPQDFLKRWMKTQGENKQEKSDEQVSAEFPDFLNQLKWSVITDKLIAENNIEVTPDELRQFAKQQLLGYMGMQAIDEEQEWIKDYINKMMKDKKYVEDSYSRLQVQKLFDWAQSQVKTTDTPISKEEFLKMNEGHKH